jgi:hypothetical protein
VPSEGAVNALIKAVCMDLCGLLENPTRESCEEDFF